MMTVELHGLKFHKTMFNITSDDKRDINIYASHYREFLDYGCIVFYAEVWDHDMPEENSILLYMGSYEKSFFTDEELDFIKNYIKPFSDYDENMVSIWRYEGAKQ